jgi:dynamin 1-like protein
VPAAIMPAQVPPTNRERVEVDIIKNLLSNYVGIVKKNIADSVPKVVMFFMVNNVKDAIQRECVTRLYKEELFDSLLEEAKDVAGRRKRCHERLQALYRVIEVFEKVRDMSL